MKTQQAAQAGIGMVAVSLLAMSGVAFGLTEVPKAYPVGTTPVVQATENDIESLVAIYDNRIVLLAGNAPYEAALGDAKADEALVTQLSDAAGSPATLAGIVNGINEIVETDPKAGVPALLAAAAVINASENADLKASSIDVIAATVRIVAGNAQGSGLASDTAALITFAGDKAPADHRAEVVRSLRSLAISQIPTDSQADYALALDGALAGFNVLSPAKASDQLLALAKTRLPNRGEGDIIDDPFDFMSDPFTFSSTGFGGFEFFGEGDGDLTAFTTGFQNPPDEPTPFTGPDAPTTPPDVPGRGTPGAPPEPPPVSP